MQDKKDLLLQSAMTLFLHEGLSVSTAEIAKAAGVATGTLFNYFPTKQDLIDQLYLTLKKEVANVFHASVDADSDFTAQLHGLWRGYIQWAVQNPLKHRVIGLLKNAHILSEEVIARACDDFRPLQALTKEALRKGDVITPDFDYFQNLLGAEIEVAVAYALRNKTKGPSLEKLIETSFEIFRRGVSSKPFLAVSTRGLAASLP